MRVALGREFFPTKDIPAGFAGSTDMGNVSHRVPSIHPMLAVAPAGVIIHNAEFATWAASPEGDKGVIDGAKALAQTALDLMLRSDDARNREKGFRSDGGVFGGRAGASLGESARRAIRRASSRAWPRRWRLRLRMNVWLLVAAVNGFLAVAFGAFAAHGLSGQIDAHALQIFETGARYHMYHALAMGLGGDRADVVLRLRSANLSALVFPRRHRALFRLALSSRR